MKLIFNINSLNYISDYQALGVEAVIVGNDDISSRHAVSLNLSEMTELQIHFEVYVLMNLLYSQKELTICQKWLNDLSKTNITGIIFQDFGLLNMAKSMGLKQKMIYAPETLNCNHETLNDLQPLGVDGAFLAREINLEAITNIAKQVNMPIMVQVHGVMYMAQSKRQLLSNYERQNQLPINHGPYILKAKDSDLKAWIYEDAHGTHIQTYEELSALDLLGSLSQAGVDYAFVDTKYMDDYRALEIVSIYHDCIQALKQGTYLRDIASYQQLLTKLMAEHDHSYGFYHDSTVYKLADVRERDNEKRNQSDR